jgi:hypothetical protein
MKDKATHMSLLRCLNVLLRGFGLAVLSGALAAPAAAQETAPLSKPAQSAKPPAAAAKKAKAPQPTVAQLQKLIEEQNAQIEAQQKLIEQQSGNIEELKKQLEQMQQALDALNKRLQELEAALTAVAKESELEARLARIEGSLMENPEVPVDVVSAGNFPGSFKVPGTDAAMRIGGLVWTSLVQTFSALGSDTQFLTYSIPAAGTPEAGQGPRLSLWAGPSRFNFDVRTPTEVGEMRAFIEGDFAGPNNTFRLRHAYGQYGRMLIGQTWSTFSDPNADHEDIDFEGLNAENVTRQAQVRYTMLLRKDLRLAVSLEYPTASISGGVSVNQIPDLIGRVTKSIPGGHLQGAVVYRQIRGQPTDEPNVIYSAPAYGGSVSGVFPVGGKAWSENDRFIFQLNGGKGIARYINDLNSCNCGEDAVFGPDGGLKALTSWGFYVDYEHHWKNFPNPLKLPLNDFRSSLMWGHVAVDNLSFMPGTSYKNTDRVSLNALWSPIPRVDIGIEYIWGQRTNQDGSRGTATQLQMRFRFLF